MCIRDSPNAILGRQVYPFLFQDAATPRELTRAMLQVLGDENAVIRARDDAADLRRVLRGDKAGFDDNVAHALAGWLASPEA